MPLNYNCGYLMSWNLFLQRELPSQWVANLGYVGTEYVRQPATVTPYNSAPFPSASTPCMANGQYNPSTGLTGSCSFQDNTIINQQWCAGNPNLACYNTGGINLNEPLFRSFYSALQSQLTRNARKNMSLGLVYMFSRAIDFEDNGAGSGSAGTTFNYPAYLQYNRGLAGYDIKHNAEVYSVYSLPFGYGQPYANHGLAAWIIGGFQLNGQFSHTSGVPFSILASTNTIGNVAPGWGSTYAQLVKPYHQLGGHNRGAAGKAAISGGRPWFDPSSFANPTEPTATAAGNPSNASPTLPNTYRTSSASPEFQTSMPAYSAPFICTVRASSRFALRPSMSSTMPCSMAKTQVFPTTPPTPAQILRRATTALWAASPALAHRTLQPRVRARCSSAADSTSNNCVRGKSLL